MDDQRCTLEEGQKEMGDTAAEATPVPALEERLCKLLGIFLGWGHGMALRMALLQCGAGREGWRSPEPRTTAWHMWL